MVKELQIPERLEIDNMETLKALSDPFRLEILKHVGIINRKGERCTVKQLGKLLDKPPTKLYYHVNMLEEHGLLVVGDTQIVSGIIEKHYQVCAMNIAVSQDLMAMNDTDDRSSQLTQIFQSIEELIQNSLDNLETSLQTIFEEATLEKEEGIPAREQIALDVSANEVVLTREQAKNYMQKLREIHIEFSELSDQNLITQNEEMLYFGVTQMIVPFYHRTQNPHKKK